MKNSRKNKENRKIKPIFFSISILPLFSISSLLLNDEEVEKKADNSLLYRLEFKDKDNLGKNTAGTSFQDATLNKGSQLSQIEAVKGNRGISFPGNTKEVNYMSLPTSVFENQDRITMTGWFYQSEEVGSYLGEFGIYSEETHATFRAEPYANYHGDSYLFMVGDADDEASHLFNTGVKPVYQAWYHMAYEFDGVNHKFNVYQNGELAISKDTPSSFSPKDFYSANSHFYLGQSAFMGTARTENKDDYRGKMSDIRIYSGLLSDAEIQTAYSLDILDFKYDEYTFDSQDSLYRDNVRGYSLKENNKTPSYEEGTLRVHDGSAIYFYDKKSNHNNRLFSGFNTMTVTMDCRIYSEDNWKRFLDFYIDGSNRITEMYSCPGISENVLKLCYNYKDTGDNWIMDGDGKDISHLNVNEWYNIGLVFHQRSLDFYLNGVKLSSTILNDNVASYSTFFYDLVNAGEGNATLGKNTYESGNYADASFDNVRFYGKACSEAEIRKAIDGENAFRLTINPNYEGAGEASTIKVKEGESYVLGNDLFEREGYVLASFNIQSDGKGLSYLPGSEFTPKSDVTLYAIWNSNSHQLHFEAEDGTRGEMPSINVTYGEEITLPECGYEKSGYQFREYNTAKDGNGASYHPGDKISISEDTTIYVLFAAKQFLISFDANQGEGSLDSIQATFDTEVKAPAYPFTRTGYLQKGWSLTKDGMDNIHEGDRIDNLSEGENMTLYAVYEKKTLHVLYDANGGTGSMEAETSPSLTLLTLKANAFEREGYHFLGWSLERDGQVCYENNATIELIDNDITLYAVWEADKKPDEPTTDKPTGGNTSDTEKPTKKGCFGSLATVSSLTGALLLILASVSIRKKKERE